jgi:2-polyprenyl-3-methyl-5-hydroxy-6-metoxy-1,4-benzoquinol methylase
MKILKFIARQKAVFSYGWGWFSALMIIYISSRELQKQLYEFNISIKIWVLALMALIGVWAFAKLFMMLGALRAENDVSAEHCNWLDELNKKIDGHKIDNNTKDSFLQSSVTWSDEKINNFWNYMAMHSCGYFTEQVGDAIINFINKKITVCGNILDYGCGNGALCYYLLKSNNNKVYACDYSNTSVEFVLQKYQQHKNFIDARLITDGELSYPSNTFDAVFLIEVIEHMDNDKIDICLNEINRILKNNGVIIITVPNNEKLSDSNIICPECNSIFHKMQHLQSFNKDLLSKRLKKYGFSSIWCDQTNLLYYSNDVIKNISYRIGDFILKKERSHLIFLGKKGEV